MAISKIFSPRRTKALHKSLTGERHGSFRRTTPLRPHRRHEQRETVCVQVRDTICVGVSKKLRTELWQSVLFRTGSHTEAQTNYHTLLQQEVPSSEVEMIEKDIGRTFPELKKFMTEEGRQSLKNVLLAYAAYDEEVGYCQGMNFLAGLLLLHLPHEDEAFAALVLLMHERGLRDLYTRDMSLLEVRLGQLSRLLPESLLSHLESLGALPVIFASSWFLTCFAATFPIQIAARVMDVVLCGSSEAFLLKLSYTFLMTNKRLLMSLSSMEDILEYMTSTLPNWKLADLQDVVSEAVQTPWTRTQRSILENTSILESLYDTISRVEDALSSLESVSASDEDSPRPKRLHSRSFASVSFHLPHVITSGIKFNPFHHIHIPVQFFVRKFR